MKGGIMNGKTLILACLAAGGPLAAWAQSLPDPTRPPAGADGVPAAEVVPAGPRLQSVLRRQGMKPAAVIDGVFVELGGRVGEARLVRVREDAVELHGPGGRQVLFLTPNIAKEVPASASVGARKPRSK